MANTSPLRLAIDRQGKVLAGLNGFAQALPAFFQSNAIDLEVQVVDPTGSVTGPAFTVVDMGSFGMRVSVGPTPTGSSGGPTVLALATLAWQSSSVTATPSRFTGNLALNTTEVDTYVGALSEKQAYLEVNLTISGTRITIYQGTFLIKAVVDELTSTAPSPADSYLTKNETLGMLARKVGLPGEVFVSVSPNGLYGVEWGCNDDGTPKINQITF